MPLDPEKYASAPSYTLAERLRNSRAGHSKRCAIPFSPSGSPGGTEPTPTGYNIRLRPVGRLGHGIADGPSGPFRGRVPDRPRRVPASVWTRRRSIRFVRRRFSGDFGARTRRLPGTRGSQLTEALYASGVTGPGNAASLVASPGGPRATPETRERR